MSFDYNNPNQAEYQVSKINSAGLINLRMNGLWARADTSSLNANLGQWYLDLESIWRNLAADAQKKDKFDPQSQYKEIQKALVDNGFFSIYDKKPGFYVPTAQENAKRHIFYRLLSQFHIFLKEVENKQGKGTAYRNSLEDDFE